MVPNRATHHILSLKQTCSRVSKIWMHVINQFSVFLNNGAEIVLINKLPLIKIHTCFTKLLNIGASPLFPFFLSSSTYLLKLSCTLVISSINVSFLCSSNLTLILSNRSRNSMSARLILPLSLLKQVETLKMNELNRKLTTLK